MPLTAYIRIRGSYIEEPVVYDLGPVWVDRTLIDGFYTKTGFTPQPTAITGGSILKAAVGNGSANNLTTDSVYGPVVAYSNPTGTTIAIPDEMTSGQALRDRTYTMSYLTFYGAAATAIAATGGTNQFTVPIGHGLNNGQLVTLTTTNALPSGLTADTLYYIVSRAATTVSLALTPGGSAITHSGAGTGTHKIVPFTEVGSFARNLNPRWSNTPSALVS